MALLLNPTVLPTITFGSGTYLLNLDIDMQSNLITHLGVPVNASDAARLLDTQGITMPVLNSSGITINVSLSK